MEIKKTRDKNAQKRKCYFRKSRKYTHLAYLPPSRSTASQVLYDRTEHGREFFICSIFVFNVLTFYYYLKHNYKSDTNNIVIEYCMIV